MSEGICCRWERVSPADVGTRLREMGKKRVSGKSMWVGINHRKPVEEEFFVHNAP